MCVLRFEGVRPISRTVVGEAHCEIPAVETSQPTHVDLRGTVQEFALWPGNPGRECAVRRAGTARRALARFAVRPFSV